MINYLYRLLISFNFQHTYTKLIKNQIMFYIYLSARTLTVTRSKPLRMVGVGTIPAYYIHFVNNNGFSSSNNYSIFYWLTKYLGVFLKNITGILISWQLVNLKLTNNKIFLLDLWYLTYRRYVLQNFFCTAWFYFFLLIQLFFFKNLEHFCFFFGKIIQKYPLKQHKHLFQVIGDLFREYLLILQTKKKLLGYRIYFKGKLGRKGSVKKSVIYFSGGKTSYTNKSLRYNYKYFLVPTETGVVGCYISVFY